MREGGAHSLLRGRGWGWSLGEHEGEVHGVAGRIGADVDAGPVALAEKVGVFPDEVAEVGGVVDVAGFHTEVRGEGLLLVWRETGPLDGLDVVLRAGVDGDGIGDEVGCSVDLRWRVYSGIDVAVGGECLGDDVEGVAEGVGGGDGAGFEGGLPGEVGGGDLG